MLTNRKETAWKAAVGRVNKITDKLGMPVDAEIVETVAILHLLNIETSMSCAGHEDRTTGGPYIIFESKKAEEYRKKCSAIGDPKDSVYKEFAHKAQVTLMQEQSRLYVLLDEFYRHRSVPFSQRLIIHTLGLSAYRLSSQGAYMTVLSTQTERRTILANNQTEMRAFTEFLKRHYFDK